LKTNAHSISIEFCAAAGPVHSSSNIGKKCVVAKTRGTFVLGLCLLALAITPLRALAAPTLTVTVNDAVRAYGADNPSFTVSYSGFVGSDDTNILSGAPTFATTATNNSPVAGSPYPITATIGTLVAPGYDIVLVSGNLTVTQAVLTVTADNKIMVYATSVPDLTVSYSGFVNGEDTNVLSGAPSLSTTATDQSIVVYNPYDITVGPGSLAADNYSFVFVNGQLNVAPATITASITVNNKNYDGTTTAVIGNSSLTGVLDTDDVVLLGNTANFDTKNIGIGKTVTATGLTLGGPDASNYALASSTLTTTADITPAGVTANIIATNKVYDGTTAATVIGRTLTGVISNEDVKVGGDTDTFDSRTIGTGKTVTATGLTLSGGDAGNYYLASTYATTTAAITRAILPASVTISDKTYDATLHATVLTLSLPGAYSNDNVTVDGGAANFTTASAGMGKAVTVTGLGLTGTDSVNYGLTSSTITTTGNILPATLNVTANNTNKVYGTPNPAFTARYSGFVAGENASVISGSPGLSTIASDNSPAGPYPIIATTVSLSATNYIFNPVNGTLTINPATLIVTANNASRAYGAADPVYTATYSGFIGSDSTNVISGAPAFATTADVHSGVNGSPYPISPTLGTLSASNYTFAFVSGHLTITQAVVTITADDKTKTYGTSNPNFTFSGSGFANNETIFQLGGQPNMTTIATAHSSVAGSPYDIVITQGTLTSANYTFAFVNGHLNINQLGLNCRIQAGDKAYDGTTFALITSRALSDPIVGDDVSLVGTNANFDSRNVGTDKAVTATNLSLGGADAGNYYLITTTAASTARITAVSVSGHIAAASKTYDGTGTATITNRSLTGVIGSDNVSLTGGIASFDSRLVGINKTVTASGLMLSGADAGNYLLSSDSATNHANISRATVTVQMTASNKIYDGTAAATILTPVLSGVFNGDDVHLTGTGTASFDTANVGTNKTVTVTGLGLSGSDISNYLLPPNITTTANILPATLTATANNASRAYGAADPVYTARYSGFIGSDSTNVISGAPAFSTTANVHSGVNGSPYPISATVGTLNAANYTFAFVNGNLTITQAVLTITADDKTKTYGTSNPNFTFSGSGFANGETIYQLGGQPNMTTAATAHSSVAGAPYDIVITQGTLTSANYTFAFVNGHLNINQLGLNCSIGAGDKAYDGTTFALITSRALSDPIAGDDVSLVGTNANFDTRNVGTNKAVTATNLNLGGADAGNYYLISTSAASTANIAAARVTGSIAAADKTYDGTANATITNRSLTGVIGSDDVSLTGGTASFNSRLIGTNKPVTASGLVLSGTDAGNYLLNSDAANTTANIFPATVAVQITASNKMYDSTAAATILTPALSGVFNGDDVHLTGTGTASFDTANVGTNKTVTVTGLGLSGSDISNYLLPPNITTTANILPATLTITANNKCKPVGCPDPTLTASCSGFVGSDTTNVLSGAADLATPVTPSTPPGVYPITVSTGTLSATNYNFNFVNGTLTVIGPATMSGNSITVTFAGNPTQTYYIQASADLMDWQTIATNIADQNGMVSFTDTITNAPSRFYRTSTMP
jgi:hypothetical protein